MFLVGSVVLILLAVALVAILDKTPSTGSGNDVRARANAKQTLNLQGMVSTLDQTKGTLLVDNVQFADNSRAGVAQNLGSWTVTPPSDFNFASVTSGSLVLIGVDPTTFQVSTHTLTAITLVPSK